MASIKAHLNLAVLAYWIVSVTKYRLKLKACENVRWDEILRIANTQVIVIAKATTLSGDVVSVRQDTQAEAALDAIYECPGINPNPLEKRKSVVHPNPPLKNPPHDNQEVASG